MPDGEVLDLLTSAAAYQDAGRIDDATTAFQNILADHPEQPDALHRLGVIALHSGNAKAAVRYIEKAVCARSDFPDAYSNLGIALKCLGRGDDAAEAYRRAITLDPGMAEAHSNLGNMLKELGQLEEAVDCYHAALDIKADYADAHCNLGIALRRLGRLDEALSAFRSAYEIAPEHPVVLADFGAALIESGDLHDAVEILIAAAKIQPSYATAHCNLGSAFRELGRVDDAARAYERAISLAPDFADARQGLACIRVLAGNLEEFWPAYEWRWQAPDAGAEDRCFGQPKWDGSSLAGRTILVWGEQGVGDELMFAGLLPELANSAKHCVVEVDSRLVSLFERSFEGVEIIARQTPAHRRLLQSDIDIQAPMADLARWLRPSLENFDPLPTYLHPDPGRVRDLIVECGRRGPGLRVGISWHTQHWRLSRKMSAPLERWLPIFGVENARFFSLQYGDRAAELESIARQSGKAIHSVPSVDPLVDLDGFAALTAAMDLVITIDNSTLTMAAALGKPVIGLLPFVADWRWFTDRESGTRCLWYPNVTLFRQPGPGDWEAVIGNVATSLKKFTAA